MEWNGLFEIHFFIVYSQLLMASERKNEREDEKEERERERVCGLTFERRIPFGVESVVPGTSFA